MAQQCNISLCDYQVYDKGQGHEGIQCSYKKCAITSEQMSIHLSHFHFSN